MDVLVVLVAERFPGVGHDLNCECKDFDDEREVCLYGFVSIDDSGRKEQFGDFFSCAGAVGRDEEDDGLRFAILLEALRDVACTTDFEEIEYGGGVATVLPENIDS